MQEDFFVVLHNMLTSRPEVSEVHCVKDAKVPLMRFKLDGISIDLPYAQLKVMSVPEVSLRFKSLSLSKTLSSCGGFCIHGSHALGLQNLNYSCEAWSFLG